MKVIFLDFDGVLNSEASFRMENRRKNRNVGNTLSVQACSNLQYILEQDRDVRLVISSTWRKIHTLTELQNILTSYGVEAAKIVGKTAVSFSGHRGREIGDWLSDNPGVVKYVVLDDDSDVKSLEGDEKGLVIQTTWTDGLLLEHAEKAATFFRGGK